MSTGDAAPPGPQPGDGGPGSGGGGSPTSIGVTLLAVIASVGTTVGFGVSGAWWLRLAIGAGAALALVALVKLGTRSGPQGAVARLARWVTSSPA